ncbi:hypothetical protein PV327_010974 [Microctonus hyperodae]|uniref:Transmembrane protein n=1 Tax=Microctonus hyperodae TaxID=165561 RepID=A0AA39FRE9_MICHY|nr:hypothetical protein PV327_010974 [Microctonus hyperodae]
MGGGKRRILQKDEGKWRGGKEPERVRDLIVSCLDLKIFVTLFLWFKPVLLQLNIFTWTWFPNSKKFTPVSLPELAAFSKNSPTMPSARNSQQTVTHCGCIYFLMITSVFSNLKYDNWQLTKSSC